jgi:hypothetical protein
MHGVGAEQAIEIVRRHPLDRRRERADRFGQPALGILGQRQAEDAAGWVLQCGLDGMQAEEAQRPVVAVGGAGTPPLITVRRSV